MTEQPLDIAARFARIFATTRYEDLPPEAIEAARKSILDTLAGMLAATGLEPALQGVLDMAIDHGGADEADIIGFGGRTSAMLACLVNGAMAHASDFDDHVPEGHHPSSSIVPVAFAMAQRRGNVSGRELLTAVAVGQDMFTRLRRAVSWKHDWQLTTVFGVFSAAATGASILGLNEAQIRAAISIASMRASGLMQMCYGTGSDLRGMYAGFSSEGAALAILLAEKNTAGIENIFEGSAGLYNVYFRDCHDLSMIYDKLGEEFTGDCVLYKPWPSCGASHSAIHLTLELMRENGLSADQVREFRIYVGDFQRNLCEPADLRIRPLTPGDAKFSIPFCIGAAAANGKVGLQNFLPEGMRDADTIAAAAKVKPVFDDQFNWTSKLPQAKLEIETHDGQIFSRTSHSVLGHSDLPLDYAFIAQKFRECAALAKKPMNAAAIAEVIRSCDVLETLSDSGAMIKLMA